MRVRHLIKEAAFEPKKHQPESSKLRLSQHGRQRRDSPPDRCPEPQRQERYHNQSRPGIQPMIRGALPEQSGWRPLIVYEISVMQHSIPVHQLLHYLVCAYSVNAIEMPARQALRVKKVSLGWIFYPANGGFCSLNGFF
jgi:hypothetical protein